MVKRSKDQKLRLRNFDWRQTRENRSRSSVQESKGINQRWRTKRYVLLVERKRPVFARRPMQLPAWEWWSCTKTDTESRSTLWAINDTRKKRVEKRKRQRQKSDWQNYSGTCTRSPCENWHPPECQFYENWTGMQSRRQVSVPALKGWSTTKHEAEKDL